MPNFSRINAIKEICARCPLAMTEDLLQDLAQYRSHKNKSKFATLHTCKTDLHYKLFVNAFMLPFEGQESVYSVLCDSHYCTTFPNNWAKNWAIFCYADSFVIGFIEKKV